MSYDVTQADLDILKQRNKEIYCRIELLNHAMKTVDMLQGLVIRDSYSIDAESDIRRTMTLDMLVKGAVYTYTRTNTFWLDKYIRVHYGYTHQRTKAIIWYPMGTYVINTSGFVYDAENSSLSLSLIDLTARINGTLGGTLSGVETKIAAGENVRDVVISTITQLGGFSRYRIDDPALEIPYEITLDTGSTVYDLLCELRDLKPSWEFFFDTDGTFIFQPIPQCIEDPYMLDESILKPLIKSENLNRTDSDVKNHIIVYGMSLNPNRYADSVLSSNNVYCLTLENFTEYTDAETICFKADIDNLENPKIDINSIGAKPILNVVSGDDEPLEIWSIRANDTVVVEYRGGNFYYKGLLQIKGEASETNCSSPFCIDGNIGVLTSVLSGGTYEKIPTDQLALERAEYELWKATRFNETVQLNIISIPFLDVNKKMGFVSLNTSEQITLITKKITGSSSDGLQNVEGIHWYPLYPFTSEGESFWGNTSPSISISVHILT